MVQNIYNVSCQDRSKEPISELQKCCELLDFVILKIADDAREYPSGEKRKRLTGKNNFKESRTVQEE